jgi:hypothetical protein
LVEAICRDFREHDDGELKKLVEWQRLLELAVCGPQGCGNTFGNALETQGCRTT